MGDGTHIEWADATWNVVTGCTRVSEGCDHCYIERTMPFRVAGRRFDGDGPGSATGLVFHPDRLDLPLSWRRPRKVFVNSMSDLFHEDILRHDDGHPFPFLARVFARMVAAPRHTFQVLTKRPGVMASVLRHPRFKLDVNAELLSLGHPVMPGGMSEPETLWPDNIWLGTSVENQKWAEARIPQLLRVPAAVRFLSVEPLLGGVDLAPWLVPPALNPPKLHWVIVGGESGPGARPMHPDWARRIRDDCVAAGVPLHFKQWGEWAPEERSRATHLLNLNGSLITVAQGTSEQTYGSGSPVTSDLIDRGHPGWVRVRRVRKRLAGRTLDGRTWDEWPRGVEADGRAPARAEGA